MVSKRQIERALLRALQDGEDTEEVSAELRLHGGSISRLKKKKKLEPESIVEPDVES